LLLLKHAAMENKIAATKICESAAYNDIPS